MTDLVVPPLTRMARLVIRQPPETRKRMKGTVSSMSGGAALTNFERAEIVL